LHLTDAGLESYIARLGDTLLGAAIAVMVSRVLVPVRTGQIANQRCRRLSGSGRDSASGTGRGAAGDRIGAGDENV
jgi:uncharacterized membrane protein YccC